MRKTAVLLILAFAAVAVAVSAAYACGEKGTTAQKTTSKASFANSGDKACPASASYVCGDEHKTSQKAMAAKADKSSEKWSTLTFAVKGMTCSGCERSLSTALADADGVKEVVKVCHKSEQAVIKVDPKAVNDAELAKLISSHGYEAEIIPAVAKTVEARADGAKSCSAGEAKTSLNKKVESSK